MLTGVVCGQVWAHNQPPSLDGTTLLYVAPEGHQGPGLICVDRAGAKKGDRVLVVTGGGARMASGDAPVDAAIVGIVADGT